MQAKTTLSDAQPDGISASLTHGAGKSNRKSAAERARSTPSDRWTP
jgi:hypothetical protein